MAFDRNDPADLATLKSEVNDDPIGMGYAPDAGTRALLDKLNIASMNVGGESESAPFTIGAMLDAYNPADLSRPQTKLGAAEYVQTLATAALFMDIGPYRAKFRAMFGPASSTVATLDAQTEGQSRAEVLFGDGTVISRDDWLAARRS